jgi:hypothetical protein
LWNGAYYDNPRTFTFFPTLKVPLQVSLLVHRFVTSSDL